jgi:hypothetical protein
MSPVICFGQQPCGFFPKRFLLAKILTARRVQAELGGEIVFFYHDSDHDPRETKTILRQRKSGQPLVLNFAFANKIQRKFSPLYLKRIAAGWHEHTALQLPGYVEPCWVDAFQRTTTDNVSTFCLEMYRHMGLLEGVRVVHSSEPAVRRAACDLEAFFVDAPYEGEIVRARFHEGTFQLHEGGAAYLTLPGATFTKEQISPTRDTRLRWMQSVVHCTHYIAGAGESAYLRKEETPEVTFMTRDNIERSDEAFTDVPPGAEILGS